MSRTLDAAFGKWQINTINTDPSGQPVNLTYSPSAAYTLSLLLTQRPSVSGSVINPKSNWVKTKTALTGYLSTAAVTLPTDANRLYGNASRNSLRDMTFNQLDLSLHKSFHLWNDRSMFDLRGKAFNVLNKVNYQASASNRSSSSVGSVTSAFPPRQLQVADKLSF